MAMTTAEAVSNRLAPRLPALPDLMFNPSIRIPDFAPIDMPPVALNVAPPRPLEVYSRQTIGQQLPDRTIAHVVTGGLAEAWM